MDLRAKNIANQKFGWLTAIAPTDRRSSHGDVLWLLRCICGKEILRATAAMLKKPRRLNQAPRSCGCNKEKNRIYTSKYGGIGDLSGHRFGILKTQAKHRNILFSVAIDYLWTIFLQQNKQCALTGVPLALSQKKMSKDETIASLDRIDSDLGYVSGNVQWVHPAINFMKHAMPQTKFVEWCSLVHKKHCK